LGRPRNDDNLIQRRYQEIHGEHGLEQILREASAAFIEQRLLLQYGDYMADHCKASRSDKMNGLDLVWKEYPSKNWIGLARQIAAEREKISEYKHEIYSVRRHPRELVRPDTPMLDSCERAGEPMGLSGEQIAWEIQKYAERNQQSHSYIQSMIDNANWNQLAETLARDEELLETVFPFAPEKSGGFRTAIDNVKEQWYEYCKRGPNGTLIWASNVAARSHGQRLLKRMESGSSMEV